MGWRLGIEDECKAAPRHSASYLLLRFVLRHIWLKPKRLRTAFTLARFLRDAHIAGFLLKTRIAHELSPQFEFALALLAGSSGYRTVRGSERVRSAEMPANRREDVAAPNVDRSNPRDFLFKGCVTDGLFKRVNEAT